MLSSAPAVTQIPVVNLARARKFYEEKLGLKLKEMVGAGSAWPSAIYQCGDGTMLALYQRPSPTKADHTVVAFDVKDIEAEVKELKKKGVVFEEYNLPGLKTAGGIATLDGEKTAWFKDTEGNILAVGQRTKK